MKNLVLPKLLYEREYDRMYWSRYKLIKLVIGSVEEGKKKLDGSI
jgi:hypothetical protein